MLLIDFTTPQWVKNMILAIHPIKNMEKHFQLPSNDPAKFIIELKKVKEINYEKIDINENEDQNVKQEFDETQERSQKEEKAHNNVSVRLIASPQHRHEIVESIKTLSNAKYQKTEWTKGPKGRFSTEMPYIVHTLYDDYGDLDHIDVCIQKIDVLFYDEEEAYLIHDLCHFLEEEINYDINNDIGYIDNEYINHPKWPQLMAKAAVAYKLMKANNEKYNWSECLHMFNNEHYEDWNKRFK